MKKISLYLFTGLFVVIISLPNTVSAYKTTDQNVYKVSDNTLLFTITYRFGFSSREVYMPIGAAWGLENISDSPYVGYEVLRDGKPIDFKSGISALVLSTAKISQNQYYLPEGKVADFTLATILKVPAGEDVNGLSVRVTHLPFIMVKDGLSGRTFLNERELEPYITPES
ncbi:MAG: hypothetical protein H6779_02780 [Candidatus Nomurabacteria bacterium]|nr:hypothetical protein [Candidatus Nomurabacteria bacterium]USN87314.1 MAG: hypothetical protein H6779_02780 [Candidatus Nomurabacteria bacterium]